MATGKSLVFSKRDEIPIFVAVMDSNDHVLSSILLAPSKFHYIIAVTTSSIVVVQLQADRVSSILVQVRLEEHVLTRAGLSYFKNYLCLVCVSTEGWVLIYRLPDVALEFERELNCDGYATL